MVMRCCPRGHPRPRSVDRCPICDRARDAERNANDPIRRLLHSPEWRRVRELVRQRHGDACAMADGACVGRLEVHHLVPVRDGGEPFDPDNCAVVCRHHHEVIERGARAAKQARLRRE